MLYVHSVLANTMEFQGSYSHLFQFNAIDPDSISICLLLSESFYLTGFPFSSNFMFSSIVVLLMPAGAIGKASFAYFNAFT